MPREELAALYRAADVMLVTPYRDGMNLVAKEYVAARGDLGGALVLSEFAGAAAELKQAFLVNPHDIAGVKNQLVRALRMDEAEGAKRMRAMRRHLFRNDLDHWANSFFDALRSGGPERGAGRAARRGSGAQG
jgi:trehalose 6-phosphate synthase